MNVGSPDDGEVRAGIFDRVPPAPSIPSTYRLPSTATSDRWQAQTPPGFVYTLKANRYLTHIKRLKDAAEPPEV